jgi:hypothetical protein
MKTSLSLHSLFTGALALGSLLCVTAAQAKTLTVPNQYTTIQAAISAAAAGDTVLVGPGFYSGSGNTGLDTQGKAVTIMSAIGPGATFLDGGATAQLFNIHSGETTKTVISGFTIQNGSASYGGGISVQGSSPTITNCIFKNNIGGQDGGGLYELNASSVISNCVFDNNMATSYGGGVYLGGGASKVSNCTFNSNLSSTTGGGGISLQADKSLVSNCTFDNNMAYYAGGIDAESSSATLSNCSVNNNSATLYGGGAFAYGINAVKLTQCDFTNNTATSGGAMFIESANPSLTDCTFTSNSATGAYNSTFSDLGGGAIWIYSQTTTARPTLTFCTFLQNSAAYVGGAILNSGAPTINGCAFTDNKTSVAGGAIYNTGAPTVNSCVFTGNTVASYGGAFFGASNSSPAMIVNTVFLNNSSEFGGALYFYSAACTLTNDSFYGNFANESIEVGGGDALYIQSNSTLTVSNCILWDSNDIYGHGFGYDLNWDSTGSLKIQYTDDIDGVVPGTGNISADPLYFAPANGDLFLQAGSPCLNKGNAKVPGFTKKDIDGVPRNPKTPAMGAYEG